VTAVSGRASAAQLGYLDELIARDESAGAALSSLDRLLTQVAERRERAELVDRELALGPAELDRRAAELAESRTRLAETQTRLDDALRARERAAEDDSAAQRAAERLLVEACDSVHIAERRVADAEAELERRQEQLAAAELEAPQIERSVAALASSLEGRARLPASVAVAPRGLAAVSEWAVETRAALLVARGGVAAEREQAIRQAGELGALVTGSPIPAGSMSVIVAAIQRELDS
jgi:hypothetical protein